MIVYHGSSHVIEVPKYNGSKKTNDYGYGFYCTKEIELANEWACPDNNDGYANEYLLDLDGLNILDLSEDKYNILNWIALLLKHRIPEGLNPNDEQTREYIIDNFSVDLTDIDIIIGYRADDSYFSFARDFVKNAITVSQLSKAMELGQLGLQVVLHSKRAFEHLTYVNHTIAQNEIYYTNLSPIKGSEQGGTRPVLIIQNDVGNFHSPTTVVAAITSRQNKAKLPTHVDIQVEGLTKNSIVLLEQVRTVDKTRLTNYVGCLDDETMHKIDRAIVVSFGIKYLEELLI